MSLVLRSDEQIIQSSRCQLTSLKDTLRRSAMPYWGMTTLLTIAAVFAPPRFGGPGLYLAAWSCLFNSPGQFALLFVLYSVMFLAVNFAIWYGGSYAWAILMNRSVEAILTNRRLALCNPGDKSVIWSCENSAISSVTFDAARKSLEVTCISPIDNAFQVKEFLGLEQFAQLTRDLGQICHNRSIACKHLD